MLFLRRIFLLILICFSAAAFVSGFAVYAEAAGDTTVVTVSIPEICRYRIEDSKVYLVDASEVIEEITVSVFSNSRREWRLAAVSESVSASVMEWSLDKETWHPFTGGSSVILSGTKAFWINHHVYYRFRKAAESQDQPVIQYQIFYEG